MMSPAQRAYRARVFAEANRKARMRPAPLAGLSSITWGTRARALGSVLDLQPAIVSPMFKPLTITMGPIPQEPPPPVFPGNPDTQPGVWTGLGPITFPGEVPPPVLPANGSPGTVPVVTTPTSGPIPAPGTVAAGTTAPASWLDQSLIGGIPNKYLLLGGLGAFLFFGGKHS
jgi:hypothetical protein